MNDKNTTNEIVVKRIQELRKKCADILSLPPEDMPDAILSEKNPAPLVHSFPEEDLYWLIHDIGPEDVLPILSLASARQLDFILDQELWEKDRIDLEAMTYWLDLMAKTDPTRFIKHLMGVRADLLTFYLNKNIDVKIREHDQDPSDFGEGYFSFDGVHYLKIREEEARESEDENPDIGDDNPRKTFVKTLLGGMAAIDFTQFINIILESPSVLPAETEEAEFRTRNIRLAEKGFLPYAEAVGVYQPISAERLLNRGPGIDKANYFKDRMISTPATPFGLLPEGNTFVRTLGEASADSRFLALQTEFAAVCNQLIVADGNKIRDRKMLDKIVNKACGFIAMGLETLLAATASNDTAISLLYKHPISDIFRVGYGRITALKQQAEDWVTNSWFSSQELSLNFWGEAWLGVLGGLLIKRPLFFDNYETGVLYREFGSLDDVKASAKILSDIMAFDHLLSLTDIRIPSSLCKSGALFYQNLVLTLWARNHLGIENEISHLPLDRFRDFYNDLWENDTRPHKIADTMKSSFLSFLAGITDHQPADIENLAGKTIKAMFREIESDFGEVSCGDIDVRYIRLFLVR